MSTLLTPTVKLLYAPLRSRVEATEVGDMDGLVHVASGTVTVPDELAEQLRDVRDELTSLDERRDELVGRRDELIVTARQQGGSLREVAELVGLSHQAVKLIEERRG